MTAHPQDVRPLRTSCASSGCSSSPAARVSAAHHSTSAPARLCQSRLAHRAPSARKAQQILDRYDNDTVTLVCDPDHFKEINDRLGHPAGAAVPAATAQRLAKRAGSTAAVGRLGGGEFSLTTRVGAPKRTALD